MSESMLTDRRSQTLPIADESFQVQAMFLGERIDVRPISRRVALNPLVAAVGSQGWAVVFRYGVVVFFATLPEDRASFISELRHGVAEPYVEPEREATTIRIDETTVVEGTDDGDELVMRNASIGRLQVIADVLAKSVVLAQYEEELEQTFNSVEPLAGELMAGHSRRGVRELLKHIGGTLLIQQKMVGRVEVSEKPDLLWDQPELERIYVRLSDEYELVPRHTALERKLTIVNTTATTALELFQAKRSLRIEWYIVFLIAFEIALTMFEMFVRGH